MENTFMTAVEKEYWNSMCLEKYLVQYKGITNLKEPFKCLNPLHQDKNSSMCFYRKGNKSYAHCMSCGANYDIFALLGFDYNLTTFNGQIGKARELFGSGGGERCETNKTEAPKFKKVFKREELDFYITNLRKVYCMYEDKHFEERGLSQEIQEKYKLCYNSNGFNDILLQSSIPNKFSFLSKSKKANAYKYILPFLNEKNKCIYYMGEIEDRTLIDQYNGKYIKMNMPDNYEAPLFNERYFKMSNNTEQVIFVTEGIYDALTIEMAGPDTIKAIACLGICTQRFFAACDYFAEQLKHTVFVLAFDNDTAGQQARLNFAKHLQEKQIKTMFLEWPQQYKDLNEFFLKEPENCVATVLTAEQNALDFACDEFEEKELEGKDEAEYELPNETNIIKEYSSLLGKEHETQTSDAENSVIFAAEAEQKLQQNIDIIEQSILHLLLEKNSYYFEFIPEYFDERFFSNPLYRSILKIILNIFKKSDIIINYHTLPPYLTEEQNKALSKIKANNATIEILPSYLQTLIYNYCKKTFFVQLNILQNKTKTSTPEKIHEIFAETEDNLCGLTRCFEKQKISFNSVENNKYFFELYEQNSLYGQEQGLKTGLDSVDQATNGFKKGDLIVLAGRAGCGKTALAIAWINYMRRQYPEQIIVFFSFEMSRKEILYRSVANICNIEVAKLKTATCTPTELQMITNQLRDYEQNNYYEYYDYNLSFEELYLKIKSLKKTKNISIVFIDHIQILSLVNNSKITIVNKNVEISIMTRKIKELALELGITIVILSQMSRDIEKRDNKMPKLSDLRDSGAIEQDANIVFVITRDDTKEKEQEQFSQTKTVLLHLLKNRDGQTCTTVLDFYPNKMNFQEKGLNYDK